MTLSALALFYARGRDASTSPVLRGELLGELRGLFLRIRVAGDSEPAGREGIGEVAPLRGTYFHSCGEVL